MKLALFFLFYISNSWARPLVLLSYFDAFGKAPFNNSQTVALELQKELAQDPDLNLKLCPLSTVFDKSYAEFENCYKALTEAPQLVLSLGEGKCQLKIEVLARNMDKTSGPDNAGNERNKTLIIPEGKKALPFTYPLGQMYCSLKKEERKELVVSNDAGSFVCNNLAYQVRYFYPELNYGFIHVPAHNCKNLSKLTNEATKNLISMIKESLKVSDHLPLPIMKKELNDLRKNTEDQCLKEFYKRVRGFDEKGLWTFSN